MPEPHSAGHRLLAHDEAIGFVRAVRPDRTHPIHDGQLNERGMASVNGWLAETTDAGYRYLAPGETA